MSLFIEKETDTDFSFDEEALAKEVTDYAIEHEGFPFEAEINLTLTDKRISIIYNIRQDIIYFLFPQM